VFRISGPKRLKTNGKLDSPIVVSIEMPGRKIGHFVFCVSAQCGDVPGATASSFYNGIGHRTFVRLFHVRRKL
jgi:hypothetical protein